MVTICGSPDPRSRIRLSGTVSPSNIMAVANGSTMASGWPPIVAFFRSITQSGSRSKYDRPIHPILAFVWAEFDRLLDFLSGSPTSEPLWQSYTYQTYFSTSTMPHSTPLAPWWSENGNRPCGQIGPIMVSSTTKNPISPSCYQSRQTDRWSPNLQGQSLASNPRSTWLQRLFFEMVDYTAGQTSRDTTSATWPSPTSGDGRSYLGGLPSQLPQVWVMARAASTWTFGSAHAIQLWSHLPTDQTS